MRDTYRVWLDRGWVTFPTSCLRTNPETRLRWTSVLESLEAVTETDKRPPIRYTVKVAEHYNQQWVSDITAEEVRHVLGRVKKKVQDWQTGVRFEGAAVRQFIQQGTASADDYAARYMDWVKFTGCVAEQAERFNSDRRKVIVIADIHGDPHCNLVAAVVEEVNRDPEMDILILIAGDLFNVFATVPALRVLQDPNRGAEVIQAETAAVVGLLHALTTHIPHCTIEIIPGNHDLITKIFDADKAYATVKILRALLGEVDPIHRLANMFPQVTVGGWNVPYVEANGTVHQNFAFDRFVHLAGDILISHTNETGRDAHRSLWKWIEEHRKVSNLDHTGLALQAHVHRAVIESVQGGHLHLGMIGFGGAIRSQNYKWNYKLWPSDVIPAFVVAHQDDLGHGSWVTVKQGHYGPRHIYI